MSILDEKSLQYAQQQQTLLREEAEAGGYSTQRINQEDAPIPTFLIDAVSLYQEEDWHISCNIVPMHRQEDAFVCVQLYLSISKEIPQEKMEQMWQLLDAQNARMMFGNLLVFAQRVSLKYTLSYEYGKQMDGDTFRHAIHMFTLQADIATKKCNALLDGEDTLEALIKKHPLSDG